MIEQLWQCVAVGVAALLLSLALTPVARGFMRRIGAVDKPDPRRVNRVPVPRGGGLAVVAAFFGALGLAWWLWPGLFERSAFAPILPWFAAASALLVAVGAVDDRFGVPPLLKLGAQIAAASILCWGGARLTLPETHGGGRSVKRLCLDRRISLSERDRLPAVYVGDRLAAVWRLGVDAEFLPEGENPCRFIQILKHTEENSHEK